MGQTDFPRTRFLTSAGEREAGHGVVRGAIRALGHQRFVGRKKAADAVNFRDTEPLFPAHGRQDVRKPCGNHAFSGAGRADIQDIVPPACGKQGSALHKFLTGEIRKIRCILRRETALRINGGSG